MMMRYEIDPTPCKNSLDTAFKLNLVLIFLFNCLNILFHLIFHDFVNKNKSAYDMAAIPAVYLSGLLLFLFFSTHSLLYCSTKKTSNETDLLIASQHHPVIAFFKKIDPYINTMMTKLLNGAAFLFQTIFILMDIHALTKNDPSNRNAVISGVAINTIAILCYALLLMGGLKKDKHSQQQWIPLMNR